MSTLNRLEELHLELSSNKETSPYMLIGATLNEKGQLNDHIVFHTLSPLGYVGVYDILAEKLEAIREFMVTEAQEKKQGEKISKVDEKLYEVFESEFDNLKAGFLSGDFNDSILNLVQKIKAAQSEITLDDIEEDNSGLA